MSRTNRTHLSDANHREARKGAVNREAAWASQPTTRRRFVGGMTMSPAVCGLWDDERPVATDARARQRRAIKRGERQRVFRDVFAEVGGEDDALDAREFFGGSADDAREYEADRAYEDADGFWIADEDGGWHDVFVGPTFLGSGPCADCNAPTEYALCSFCAGLSAWQETR